MCYCQHRRRKIFISGGGRNLGETCRMHVACRRHAMLGGPGACFPGKSLNFRCVFLQSGGIQLGFLRLLWSKNWRDFEGKVYESMAIIMTMH